MLDHERVHDLIAMLGLHWVFKYTRGRHNSRFPDFHQSVQILAIENQWASQPQCATILLTVMSADGHQ